MVCSLSCPLFPVLFHLASRADPFPISNSKWGRVKKAVVQHISLFPSLCGSSGPYLLSNPCAEHRTNLYNTSEAACMYKQVLWQMRTSKLGQLLRVGMQQRAALRHCWALSPSVTGDGFYHLIQLYQKAGLGWEGRCLLVFFIRLQLTAPLYRLAPHWSSKSAQGETGPSAQIPWISIHAVAHWKTSLCCICLIAEVCLSELLE